MVRRYNVQTLFYVNDHDKVIFVYLNKYNVAHEITELLFLKFSFSNRCNGHKTCMLSVCRRRGTGCNVNVAAHRKATATTSTCSCSPSSSRCVHSSVCPGSSPPPSEPSLTCGVSSRSRSSGPRANDRSSSASGQLACRWQRTCFVHFVLVTTSYIHIKEI